MELQLGRNASAPTVVSATSLSSEKAGGPGGPPLGVAPQPPAAARASGPAPGGRPAALQALGGGPVVPDGPEPKPLGSEGLRHVIALIEEGHPAHLLLKRLRETKGRVPTPSKVVDLLWAQLNVSRRERGFRPLPALTARDRRNLAELVEEHGWPEMAAAACCGARHDPEKIRDPELLWKILRFSGLDRQLADRAGFGADTKGGEVA